MFRSNKLPREKFEYKIKFRVIVRIDRQTGEQVEMGVYLMYSSTIFYTMSDLTFTDIQHSSLFNYPKLNSIPHIHHLSNNLGVNCFIRSCLLRFLMSIMLILLCIKNVNLLKCLPNIEGYISTT